MNRGSRAIAGFTALAVMVILFSVGPAGAQEGKGKGKGNAEIGFWDTPILPNMKWHVHDPDRPKPPVVAPGTASTQDAPGKPPSDAIVLFDGKDLSRWRGSQSATPTWKVENGYFEVAGRGGDLLSKDSFGSCQLHVEWAAPAPAQGVSQGRGNSGVILMSRYEIQVLDVFENSTYADGGAGAIYGQYPPLVNAARKPGEWQTYDIVFIAPRFENGKLAAPARFTVFINGVLVQHDKESLGPMVYRALPQYQPHGAEEPLMLQNHNNPVRYRNIWLRRLGGYDQN